MAVTEIQEHYIGCVENVKKMTSEILELLVERRNKSTTTIYKVMSKIICQKETWLSSECGEIGEVKEMTAEMY